MNHILFGVALFVLACAAASAHERDHIGDLPIPSWYVVTSDGKLYQFYSRHACIQGARYLTLQKLNPSNCVSSGTKGDQPQK